MKHYNVATRRGAIYGTLAILISHRLDAILGLRELLDSHPGLLSEHLTALFNACVRLIGDEVSTYHRFSLRTAQFILP